MMLRKKSSQRSLAYRAVIPLVADGIVRPRWSVMIPTHNCARYLRETLTSVLAQDPGPDVMQIEVVDDHSTKDDPEQVEPLANNARPERVLPTLREWLLPLGKLRRDRF
jgi:glycosyltransferase involved in cell wall biosynthesis